MLAASLGVQVLNQHVDSVELFGHWVYLNSEELQRCDPEDCRLTYLSEGDCGPDGLDRPTLPESERRISLCDSY